MDEKEVRRIVCVTVDELKKAGYIKKTEDIEYSQAAETLAQYYRGIIADPSIDDALDAISDDEYFQIIPLYFGKRWTNERLAELYDV